MAGTYGNEYEYSYSDGGRNGDGANVSDPLALERFSAEDFNKYSLLDDILRDQSESLQEMTWQRKQRERERKERENDREREGSSFSSRSSDENPLRKQNDMDLFDLDLDLDLTSLLDDDAEEFKIDLIDLEATLKMANESLLKLSELQEGKLEQLSEEKKRLSSEFNTELKTYQNEYQQNIMKNFKIMEKTMRRISNTSSGIGKRLKGIDDSRNRTLHARNLLQYFQQFVYLDSQESLRDPDSHGLNRSNSVGLDPVFTDFPSRLHEAAPLIVELKSIVDELSAKGSEAACKRIEDKKGEVFKGLLEAFDNANTDKDYHRMQVCADAILDNFYLYQDGAEKLFKRFIYYSLEPLLAVRRRSRAYKLAAMQENLVILFNQIRNVVRTQHGVVKLVFPDYCDQVMTMLLERLFNDQAYGLQPVLEFFLYPPHRDGKLPAHEYLQVLASAQFQTEMLAQDLTVTASSATSKTVTASLADRNRNKKTVLKRQKSSMKSSNGSLSVSFDSEFIIKQTYAVFEQFMGDYTEREVGLFNERVGKALYASIPKPILQICCPDLEDYSVNVATVDEEGAVDKTDSSNRSDKRSTRFFQNVNESINIFPPKDPSGVLLNNGALNSVKVGEVVVRALGLNTDIEAGIPDQVFRWAKEAHLRCMQLLARKRDEKEKGMTVLLAVDENDRCFETIELLFTTFCTKFFRETLVPIVDMMIAQLPICPTFKPGDADGGLGVFNTSLDSSMDGGRTAERNLEDLLLGYVDTMGVLPSHLPVMAVNNSTIKFMLKQLQTLGDPKDRYEETKEKMTLFCSGVQAIRLEVEKALQYWKNYVFVSIRLKVEKLKTCQHKLEQELDALEKRISFGFERLLGHVNMNMQAIILCYQNKNDYNFGSADTSFKMHLGSKSVLKVSEFLEQFLYLVNEQCFFSNVDENDKCKKTIMARACLCARDVILASWRRVKISQQGSIKLMRDVDTITTVIRKFPVCIEVPGLVLAWDIMREIVQLFIVGHDSLAALIKDKETNLGDLQPQFIYDIISRRSDFTANIFNSKSAWAKKLFEILNP